MAHGNVSDMVFLALLVIAIQLFALQGSLFTGSGAFIDENNNSDTSILMSVAGALFLMIGFMFSGVKWDRINGKGAGVVGFLAFLGISYCTYDLDGAIVPNFLYLYALVLLAGSIHIFFFPANAVPARADGTNKKGIVCVGVFSDYANENFNINIIDTISVLLFLVACGIIYNPFYLMKDHNMGLYIEQHWPTKALLTPESFSNPAVYALIKLICFLTIFIASIFSSVQWHTINGKLAGIGGFLACGIMSFITYQSSIGFVVKPTYEFAFLLLAGTLHIFAFPGHPKPVTEPPAEEKKEGLAASLLP